MKIVSCHTDSTIEDDASSSSSTEATTKSNEFPSLGINDLLALPREIKDTIIKILKNNGVLTVSTSQTKVGDSCCVSIAFSDENLLLGSKLHNRPLFV